MLKRTALALFLILALLFGAVSAVSAEDAPETVIEVETEAGATAATEAETPIVPEENDTPAPAQEPLTLETVLATVNGQDVTMAQVNKYFQGMMQQYSQMMDVSDPQISALIKETSVNYAVTEEIILQKAQERGLDQFTQEELDKITAEADAMYQNTLDQYKSMFKTETNTEEEQTVAAEAFLKENGYTIETLFAQMKDAEAYTRMMEDVTKDVALSDDDLRALFDKQVEEKKAAYEADISQYDSESMSGGTPIYTPEGLRSVKHILIMIDTGMAQQIKELRDKLAAMTETDADYAETQTQLDALMADIQPRLDEVMGKIEAGEDFQSLIDEYGEDPGMKDGSPYRETGYAMSQSTKIYEMPFTEAGMALEKIGDVSEPVLGTRGFHIIRYDHDVESGPADFEMIKEQLRTSELAAAKQQAEAEAVEAWTKEAKIETFMDRFN